MADSDCAHVDISYQIDNPWNKDTALAFVINGDRYTVKIRAKDKNNLREKYCNEGVLTKKERKENRSVVVMIYSFMLYHLLEYGEGLSDKVIICNDVSPTYAVTRFLDIVNKVKGGKEMNKRKMKMKFRKKSDGKSKAHRIAKKVAKGQVDANLTFKKKHLDILKCLIKNECK